MTIKIFFAKAIKQKTANYPWLDYEGYGPFGKKPWIKETDDYWSFESWLIQKFKSERIDKRDFQNLNKDVLVVKPSDSLSDYVFFSYNGILADLYRNNKLNELFEEFINDRK